MSKKDPTRGVIRVTSEDGIFKFGKPSFSGFSLEDFARTLAKKDRYGSWLMEFYPVATHSVHVSRIIEIFGGDLNEQRWGLVHDASESVIGDFQSPFKRLVNYKSNGWLRHYEDVLLRQIADRFDLAGGECDPYPEIVHKADKVVTAIEVRDLWGEDYRDHPWDGKMIDAWQGIVDDYHIDFEDWREAHESWMRRAKELGLK